MPHARTAGRRLADAIHAPIALFLAWVGARSLAGDTPSGVEVTLPLWLTTAWGAALIVGAVLVLVATATDRTRAESAGHGFLLFGILLYSLANVAAFGHTLVSVLVLAAVSILRLRILSRSRAARREAGRLLTGQRSGGDD